MTEAPAPAEAVVAAPEPAPAEAPAAEAAPAEEAAAPEAEAEAAPVEGEGEKPAVEAGAEGEKPAAEPAPVYTEFKMPEGMQAAAPQMEAFTAFLGENNLSQEAGQKLIDLHAAAIQDTAKQMAQGQRDQFDGMRRDWREDFFKSNGNRADTVANDAKWLIKEFSPNADDRKALQQVLAMTGAGDNKLVVGLLARAAKKLREATPGPRPLPNNGRSGDSRPNQRYGNQR